MFLVEKVFDAESAVEDKLVRFVGDEKLSVGEKRDLFFPGKDSELSWTNLGPVL